VYCRHLRINMPIAEINGRHIHPAGEGFNRLKSESKSDNKNEKGKRDTTHLVLVSTCSQITTTTSNASEANLGVGREAVPLAVDFGPSRRSIPAFGAQCLLCGADNEVAGCGWREVPSFGGLRPRDRFKKTHGMQDAAAFHRRTKCHHLA
jgi:hypothetical protein